jgi:hypothetical protein
MHNNRNNRARNITSRKISRSFVTLRALPPVAHPKMHFLLRRTPNLPSATPDKEPKAGDLSRPSKDTVKTTKICKDSTASTSKEKNCFTVKNVPASYEIKDFPSKWNRAREDLDILKVKIGYRPVKAVLCFRASLTSKDTRSSKC